MQRDGAFVVYSSFNISYLGRSKAWWCRAKCAGQNVQGKITISWCFAAFFGGGTTEKSEIG